MADDRNRWLDSAAAERMLRGEPVGPVADRHAADEAARLRAVLDELAASAAPADSELPGEAAALAAFRTARGPAGTQPEHEAEPTAGSADDRGPLVALGRTTIRRPVRNNSLRLGLAAAVAGVALGGVAAATGSGLFGGTLHNAADPRPAVSVTTGPSSSPGERAAGGTTGPGTPEGGHSRLRDNDRSGTPGTGGTPTGPGSGQPGTGTGGNGGDGDTAGPDQDTGAGMDGSRDPATRMIRVADLCRAHRAGRITLDGREKLARAAKGVSGIDRFCDRLLNGDPDTSGSGGGAGGTGGKGGSGGDGSDRSGDSDRSEDPDPDPDGTGGRRGTGSTSSGILQAPTVGPAPSRLSHPAPSGADIPL
ncbi:hypothetical protein [Streptomyces sp. NPDC048603]|uniref:hypothetical protein n=1 Tax=Streptomyces sp. NPDC048603 TaxID=3365577 RepID=UPI0037201E64